MGYKRVDSYDNARDKVKHKIRFRLLPLHQQKGQVFICPFCYVVGEGLATA